MNCEKSHIDTIIFDLGGVLVDWNPAYLYLKIFNGDEVKTEWFLNNVCTPLWNMEQDAGRSIAEGEQLKIAEYPEYEQEIKLFYKDWEHMFKGTIQENVILFQQLKATKKYKIYALTNWSAEKWEKALQLFPFFNEFDGVVVSGIEKTRKPFEKIYKILINRFHIKTENAIFIDDNVDNVKTAIKLKIHGIHYLSQNQLIKDLESKGINLK